MHFRVSHDTLYRYDVPVVLGVHLVRLSPRPGTVERVSQRLVVEPAPLEQLQLTDGFGNQITRLIFADGATRSLRVLSELELGTYPVPDLDVDLPSLPWPSAMQVDDEVRRFARNQAERVGYQPVAFLDALSQALFERIDRRIRPSGDARPAAETLALGSGACRDVTIVFLEACRSVGISGRFVSGYQAYAATPNSDRQLHAWAEVELPQIGFRGWDATHGSRAGEGHVPLCAAPHQSDTMPIQGSYAFQGALLNTTLDCRIQIATDHAA